MKTLNQNSKAVGSSAYWGERGEWLIAAAVHRDSDCLERSNFECMRDALTLGVKEESEWQGVAIERFNHWAVGWVDYLIVDPKSIETVQLAEKLRAKIDDYPVLDEEHFSRLENDEANDIWRDCYRPKERVEYIREHRSQFEFRDFADLLGCVRGKYFAGYAGELVNR